MAKLGIAIAGAALGMALAMLLRRNAPSRSAVFYHDPATMAVIGGLLAFGIAQASLGNSVTWSQAVVQVDSAEKLDAFLAASKDQAVLVDFYATWCPPCRAMAPNVDALAAEGARVAVVDVDAAPQLASQYQIESLPTLLVFREGRMTRMELGYHSKEDLRALLKG